MSVERATPVNNAKRRQLFFSPRKIAAAIPIAFVSNILIAWSCILAFTYNRLPRHSLALNGKSVLVWNTIGREFVSSAYAKIVLTECVEPYPLTPAGTMLELSKLDWSITRRSRSRTANGWEAEEACGWPFLSLKCSQVLNPTRTYWSIQDLSAQLRLPTGQLRGLSGNRKYLYVTTGRVFPCVPIVFGTLGNVAVLFLPSLAVVNGIRRAQCWARLRCGKCPDCAFPLLNTRCSECGFGFDP